MCSYVVPYVNYIHAKHFGIHVCKAHGHGDTQRNGTNTYVALQSTQISSTTLLICSFVKRYGKKKNMTLKNYSVMIEHMLLEVNILSGI